MKTDKFLELLEQNPEKALLFEYQIGQFVPKAYHITEIKNVSIESVDCGGRPHSEQQTIVQLWHNGKESGEFMPARKAMKIFDVVDKIKPITRDTEIYFEYGNERLNTSNYKIQRVLEEDEKITFQLFVEPTACKPKLEISEVASFKNLPLACQPGSGCC